MSKRKRKLSRAEKAAKAKRRQEYETIFINGKMKRVRRPPTIEDMDVDDFVRQNADCRAIKSPARLISIAAAPGERGPALEDQAGAKLRIGKRVASTPSTPRNPFQSRRG